MPLPVIALSAVGSIIAGVTAALATKAGTILASAGLMFIAVKGIQNIVGFAVQDVNNAMSFISAYGAGIGSAGASMGLVALKMAGFIGLFDAINILISGYMSTLSVIGAKVMLARLK